jgi:putative restriction endonuclease
MSKYFGAPPGVHVGMQFIDRKDLRAAGVHPPLMNGIHGTREEGADSIVLSGGYKDDADFGDYILYTGEGGRAPNGAQVEDQSEDSPGNAGLITSRMLGLPVRVTRGYRFKSAFSPKSGLRYAGLFLVTDWSWRTGSDGFKIIQFRLDRLPDQEPYVASADPVPDAAFSTTTVSRRIRDSAMAREVKSIYDFRCQVCGVTIEGFEGRPYAEGAHVRPLGRPHLGRDTRENLLCLCPNHHTQLDNGGLLIADDMTVEDRFGTTFAELTFKQKHLLLPANATYHREFWTKVS